MASCTAGARDWCSIDCKSGRCIAYYSEPSGPCLTRCLDDVKAKRDLRILLSPRFSLHALGMTASEMTAIFVSLSDGIREALRDIDEEFNLKLTDATLSDLENTINNLRPRAVAG